MITVKVKKNADWAKMPYHGSENAAGWDLYSDDIEHEIYPGETVLISTGLSMEIPDGYAGLIFPRSGLATKSNISLANCIGLIDSDYRGIIQIAAHNISMNKVVTIQPHERIGQLVIIPYPEVKYEENEELNTTIRGEGGFGSTGTK